MTYEESVRYLFDLQFVGIKLGLDNIRELCAFWGDPQRRYPVVHVAGTNGKGSTAAFLASMLTEAGYRTGLYTSPHLLDFSERLRVDGDAIGTEDVVRYTQELQPEIDRLKATFFEATTAMAFRYFAERHADIAIVETGLGGRLDATNIVAPMLTVITNVGIDHTEHLGSELRTIAAEKGGIIKAGVPVLTAAGGEALAVLQEIAGQRDAPLQVVRADELHCKLLDFEKMMFRLDDGREYETALIGRHQLENAALAHACVPALRSLFPLLVETAVERGFRNVRVNSGIRGRCERLRTRPDLVVDVAHNAAGVRVLLDAWLTLRRPEQTCLVFGMLRNKDAATVMELLARYAWKKVYLVAAASPDALAPSELAMLAGQAQLYATPVRDLRTALGDASQVAGRDGAVLLFGSHYLVGPVLADTAPTGRGKN